MSAIFGLDCTSPTCRHDMVHGYRLRFQVRRDAYCWTCRRAGVLLPPIRTPDGTEIANRYRCSTCQEQWRYRFERERRDMLFQAGDLLSAQSQMRALGAVDQLDPGTAHLIERHPSLPVGYDARLLLLIEESLPKTALYLRWEPESGQILTPDLVFQCAFAPNATAAERHIAPQRSLSPEQFQEITFHNESGAPQIVTSARGVSTIRCQHCGDFVPLKALTTYTLREVEIGD